MLQNAAFAEKQTCPEDRNGTALLSGKLFGRLAV